MADSQFSNVVLLLPCDGADASTSFADASPSAHSIYVFGGAQISTAQSKFGGSSLQMLSAGSQAVVDASADFDFGTGDFTIEFFAWKSASLSGYDVALSCDPTHAGQIGGTPGGWTVQLAQGGGAGGGFGFASGGGAFYLNQNSSIVADSVWRHWAVCRQSGTTRIFRDGYLQSSASNTSNYSGSGTLSVGAYDDGEWRFNGYLDCVRITKGVARYTASFTPPTESDFSEDGDGLVTADLTIPVPVLQADFGGRIMGAIPVMALDASMTGPGLITADLPIPVMTLDAQILEGGKLSAELSLPMMTLDARAHDATGENSMQGVIPMMTMSAGFGAKMSSIIPMMALSAGMTGTALIRVELTLPMMTLAASGMGSPYVIIADLRVPMMTLRADGGASASLSLPMMTLDAAMTAGGLLTADLRVPMMTLDAQGTRQGMAWADLSIPVMVPVASITADLSIPMMALNAAITAVVTVGYEAYSVNLTHAPGNPAPVDEVTRYTGFAFTQIVRFQGGYFGVAADGLYQLGGATDNGAPIAYAVKTCLDDFKTPELKTVASAFLAGRLGPDVTVSLYAGEDAEEAYDFNTLRGTAARNHREKFGRGVKDRYFALGLAGTDALELDSIELEINKLKRRT